MRAGETRHTQLRSRAYRYHLSGLFTQQVSFSFTQYANWMMGYLASTRRFSDAARFDLVAMLLSLHVASMVLYGKKGRVRTRPAPPCLSQEVTHNTASLSRWTDLTCGPTQVPGGWETRGCTRMSGSGKYVPVAGGQEDMGVHSAVCLPASVYCHCSLVLPCHFCGSAFNWHLQNPTVCQTVCRVDSDE